MLDTTIYASAPRELAVLDEACRLLEEAKSLEDVKTLRDKAQAAKTFIKAARLGLDLQNRAAELKLRAERKAGKLLSALHLRGGNRRSKRHRAPLKLEDLGISRDQSRRWQHVASVTDEEFSRFLQDTIDRGGEITSAGLMRIARRAQARPRRRPVEDAVYSDSDTSVPNELLVELTNHCQLLAEVLRPVYQEAALDLRKVERRVIGRLIGEMTGLISQLSKTWSASNPPGPLSK
jgi:hypothetical protein